MKFDDLDSTMRMYKTMHDYCVLPEVYMASGIKGACNDWVRRTACLECMS